MKKQIKSLEEFQKVNVNNVYDGLNYLTNLSASATTFATSSVYVGAMGFTYTPTGGSGSGRDSVDHVDGASD